MRRPEDSTPFCEICGAQIELLEDAVVILKGQFLWMPEEQYAPLVLEPGTEFEVVQLETSHMAPQKALVVNPEAMGELTAVHRECLIERFEDPEDDEDDLDEDTPDLDDLDTQMMHALSREEDDDPYFSRR